MEEQLLPPQAFLVQKRDNGKVDSEASQLDSYLRELQIFHHLINVDNSAVAQELVCSRVHVEDEQQELTALRSQIHTHVQEAAAARRELAALRLYMRDLVDRNCPAEESSALRQRIEELQATCQTLQEAHTFMQVRLNATAQIVRIQEQEALRQVPCLPAGTCHLLEVWRQRVFALLVQRESSALQSAKEDSQRRAELADVKASRDATAASLEAARQRATALEAEVQEVRLCKERSTRENDNLRRRLGEVEDELATQKASVMALFDAVKAHAEAQRAEEQRLVLLLRRMDMFAQRLLYAAERLPVVQAHIFSGRALLALRSSEAKVPPVTEVPLVKVDRDEEMNLLRKEMERLRHERDALVCRLQEESVSLQERVVASKKQVEAEVLDLHKRAELAESKMQEQAATIAHLVSDREAQDAHAKKLEQHLVDTKVQLEEVRQEQSTMAMTLRLAERQAARDKTQLEAKLEEESAAARTALQQSEDALCKSRAECNLLRSTLRQEGLLSRADERIRLVAIAAELRAMRESSGSDEDSI